MNFSLKAMSDAELFLIARKRGFLLIREERLKEWIENNQTVIEESHEEFQRILDMQRESLDLDIEGLLP